jgi:LuxR family maltose regulon positive regulatory protein
LSEALTQRATLVPSAVIVATKLHVPAPRAGLVRRSELVAAIAQGAERKLTLLNALPGSGKTTLLSEWAASHE